jgi:hypothetical protein
MAALSSLYAAAVFRNDPHLLSLQYKLKMMSLSTDWIENEHFRLVFMKMSIFKSKTGSLHSGTEDSDVGEFAVMAFRCPRAIRYQVRAEVD